MKKVLEFGDTLCYVGSRVTQNLPPPVESGDHAQCCSRIRWLGGIIPSLGNHAECSANRLQLEGTEAPRS